MKYTFPDFQHQTIPGIPGFNIQPMPNWLPNMTSTLLPTPASQTVAGHVDHKSGSGFVPSRFLGHSGPLAALVRLVWKGPTP